jgi:hypothetical protein
VFVGTDYSARTALTVQKPISPDERKKTAQIESQDTDRSVDIHAITVSLKEPDV